MREARAVAVAASILGVGACAHTGGGRMHDVQHVSVTINRHPADVYEFASDPRNLPRWAAGLVGSEVTQEGLEIGAMTGITKRWR